MSGGQGPAGAPESVRAQGPGGERPNNATSVSDETGPLQSGPCP